MDKRPRPISDDDAARGTRFRELRKHFGFTQDRLAELASIPRGRMPKIESGLDRFTSLGLQQAMAGALHVGLGDLVEYLAGAKSLADVVRAKRKRAA